MNSVISLKSNQMLSVMSKTTKVYVFLLFSIFLSKELVSLPLLGLEVEGIVKPLTSIIDLKEGGKLGLMEMLNLGQILTPDGGTVEEGDIVNYHAQTKGMKDDGDLWPGSIIPYMFHQSVDNLHKNLLKEAMSHWEEHTCLHFRPKNKKDKNYLRFRTDTSGCWSAVGRRLDRPGPQDISLGRGCFKFYTGHSIGYLHEHSRRDRDEFVEVIWSNVKPGMNVQFQHKNTRNEILKYDYRSIMHYPAWAFSKTPLKANVVLSKNPFSQYKIDEDKNSISFRDIKLTNMLYKCNEKCPNLLQTNCQNEGILIPNKLSGNDCSCLCAPGFGGDLCQNIENINEIDPNQPKCGGNITEQGVISTPNYPLRKEEFQSCSYWIKAPTGHRVRVTFDDFSFAQPYEGNGNSDGLCLYESVDIRKSDNIYEGSLYCGQQIKANTIMESEANDFIIIIIADDQKRGRGFKARIEFIEDKDQSLRKMKHSPKNRPGIKPKPKKKESLIQVLDGLSL